MTNPYEAARGHPPTPTCGRSRLSLASNGYGLAAVGSKSMTVGLSAAIAPAAALAEVSDKIPSLPQIWGIAGIAALALLLAMRFKPRMSWLILPLLGLWFTTLLLEVHSADVGPAIVSEQGVEYIVQVYLAGGLAVAAAWIGWRWRKRRST